MDCRERNRGNRGNSVSLPRPYARKLWRAICEFDLISPDDRILVGFSGGKDSSFLVYALAAIREYSPVPFEVGALTVDLGFGGLEAERLQAFCEALDVPFYLKHTDIATMALAPGAGQNPCAVCAYHRRGAMNNFALENGYNKIALAHHHDDAIETLLMSIIYSGQIRTFLPRTYLDRTGLTVIRPLVYFRECEIKSATRFTGFEPAPSPCPMNGRSKRAEIKALIRELTRKDRSIYDKLSAALRMDAVIELWPPVPSREELYRKHRAFFKNKGARAARNV
ncbi:MAG TPA: tRNA 2-thiocytidine biosynthesis protein TtcA [Firmicutes bacterium]|nr:tRNA 2-thiocytidine biosynthesis protein TtcA [Bacillota bacterium]